MSSFIVYSPTPLHRRSWWSNPDKINKVEDLALMECALRESLNAVHVQKVIFPKTGLMLVFDFGGT